MKGRIKLYTPISSRRQQITLELEGDMRDLYDELHDEEIDVTLKKYRPRRSLNANAYAWKLIGELAEKMNLDADEIYRDQIRHVGVSEIIEVSARAATLLEKTWGNNGVGWFTEIIMKSRETVTMKMYYGSSVYNTKQMARLIDNLVQDCKAVGIPTDTPEEIERIKSLWETIPRRS